MYSDKQVYENCHEVERRPCNWKCTRRLFVGITVVAILSMLGYIVYRMETSDDVTRAISLLRDELHAVKTEFEQMPNMPHQSDKMKEIISKMETITQQLYDASQLKNQEVAKLTEEHAEMKTILNSANDKLDGIGVVNQNLQAQSQETSGLKKKLEEMDSKTNFMRETLREIKGDIMGMQNQLHNGGNGSRSSSTPSGMIHICWIVVLCFLFKN